MINAIAEKTNTGRYFEWSTIDVSERPVDYSLFDESLRDGLQASYIAEPGLDAKLRLVDHMSAVGITSADLGFPGAGKRAFQDCLKLAKYVSAQHHPMRIAFAGRTHPEDLRAICDVAQQAQCQVDAYAFTAISPVRQQVEGWSIDGIESRVVAAERQCRSAGVNFVLVLEDTTRCTPQTLTWIYGVAASLDVRRITLCDTVGAANPASTRALVRWSLEFFRRRSQPVAFDWHGHNDRGLALINAMVALESGCDRLHGTVLGIGERAGNTAIDQLIVNRCLQYGDDFDLQALRRYCESASELLNIPIPVNYPALGSGVFTTSVGVHAAAILKAKNSRDDELLDSVYSSVPARLLGRCQEVLIDASSGASNVEFWLSEHGYESTPQRIHRVLTAAKKLDRVLTTTQIADLIDCED